MKNFKLLLKNSIKSLWNSRGLVLQFTLLTTIATTVVSSVALGNFSLRNAMAEVQSKSNANGISIKEAKVNDFASYNIINESNKLIESLDNLSLEDAIGTTKIYNPLNNFEQTKTILTVNGQNYETYGFFNEYSNEYKDPLDNTIKYYTDTQNSKVWNNIIFSNKDESLSIITNVIDSQKYAKTTSDIFTFYNNILPPSPTEINETKFQTLFDPNIYSFNPWSITTKKNNKELYINNLGIGQLENFENEFGEKILFNHGILNKEYSHIVGTNINFLEDKEMQKYKESISTIDNDIKLTSQFLNFFSNDWKQESRIINFNSEKDFNDYSKNYFEPFNFYNNNYWKYLNSLNDQIKNNFVVDSKFFSFDYKINVDNSFGISNFFGDIYENPENKFHNQFNKIFKPWEEKFFKGKIKIPLIPFITVQPKIDDNTAWSIEQYKEWAAGNDFLNPTKSEPNIKGINGIINNTFEQLSIKTNEFLKRKLNSNDVSTEIKNKYYTDYDINYFLNNELKLNFSKSSNFTISDSKQNTYILSKSKYYTKEKVNDLVIKSGSGFIDNKYDKDYIKLSSTSSYLFSFWRNRVLWPDQNTKDFFRQEAEFWSVMNILKELKLNTNENIKNEYYRLIKDVNDTNLFEKDFEKWRKIASDFMYIYDCSLFKWNGAGYNVEFTRKNNLGISIDFNGYYYEPSSYSAVASLNYSKIKNGSKGVINTEFATKAMKLPFKQEQISNSEITNNLSKYVDNFIYNPYSRKWEFYNDFLDWLNRIDSKYKIDINGDEFVIFGTGISSEFVYPISSSNQLLINNNSPVIFTNELGYDKLVNNNTIYQQTNYFANFKNRLDIAGNSIGLNKINKWTERVYKQKLAYFLSDSNQPNQLLYLRMNFPYTILSSVLTITLTIAAIVVLLAFIFIYVLMKSIVNQNMNTFAVGMANGISKTKLLFSFMPFVLIPSLIACILGYSLSFAIYPIISNSIQSYWILNYIHFSFNFGYLIFAFIIVTVLIFAVQTVVIFIMLNKNVSNLLNTKMEFKYNKLVQGSHKLVSKLKPLTSFRITYMLGNIGRFLLLLFMMTSFVSLTTISASSLKTFDTAMTKTMDNKQYNYAIDLVSPSIQGGYYYDIPYDLIGTRQKGLIPLYNLNSEQGFYNKDYKNDMSFNVPQTNETLVYENMFFPSADLIGDVLGNITFFRNKIGHLLTMDFGINFLGNYINPWEWAKKIIPSSVVNIVEEKNQEQLNLAFLYICWLNAKNINENDKNIWLYDSSIQNSFIDSFNNSSNPEEWDQTNWLIQLVKIDNKYVWKSNEQYLSKGLPTFAASNEFTRLFTRIISLKNDPYYQKFINELEQKQNKKINDPNFMLGLNVIPVIQELDETYTYINATSNLKFKNKIFDFKIQGIKPNSNQLVLWNEYDKKDLKDLFLNYEIIDNVYPLIINEVSSKKYGLRVNDEIKILANNKIDRFVTKFENKLDLETYKFKVIGITTSKSEEQYYTTQEIANKILGYEKPKLATLDDLKNKNYDYKWVNQEEIDNYVPFNGVFSKQELPKMLGNFATLYSLSGLSPIGGSLPNSYNGDSYGQIKRNYSELNKILKTNFIDETKPKDFEHIMSFKEDFIKTFGNDKYYSSAIANMDIKFASKFLGQTIDNTLYDVNLVCVISLLPAILIIIVLMSYMIVVESRRLVALLKVLGFSNWSNTITLSTVQFVVVGLSLLLGYGFSAIILSILKAFAFKFLSIIINPIIPTWTLGITIGVLLLIVSIITLTIFMNLRKTNPAQEIAIR